MQQNSASRFKRFARLVTVGVLAALLTFQTPLADAQRGRGGGGFRSGGSFGGSRSGSFGGSFGGGRSGSFGNSAPRSGGTFGGAPRAGSSSGGTFGRSGSFGGNRTFTQSSSARWSPGSSTYVYRGSPYPVYGGGMGLGFMAGYSLGYWSSPAWYYHTPFHPAFYVGRPYMSNGMIYPGGFNWLNFILGIAFFIFIFWLLIRLFAGGGGGRRVRYTTYG